MNTFWLKIAGFSVVAVGLVILISVFSSSEPEPKPEPKTVYDVWKQDDKRLRAKPEPKQPSKTEQAPVTKRAPDVKKVVEPAKQQFKELSEEDKVRAEQLFEMALTQRKMGRLPGMGYKKMVDYCRQIIEEYPDSIFAFKARRMLADIPERFRKQYKITDKEINPEN